MDEREITERLVNLETKMKMAKARMDMLLADNNQLRLALKPFASFGAALSKLDEMDTSIWTKMGDGVKIQLGQLTGWTITAGELRLAYRALRDIEDKGGYGP